MKLNAVRNGVAEKTEAFKTGWADPELNALIDEGIERHRKRDVELRLLDTEGHPVANAVVKVAQTDSAFHFGGNLFMLDGYESEDLNRRYEEAFCGLFNAATVPFYWESIEPVQGFRRLDADSKPMSRRPPPDRSVEFCQERELKMHGHVLVWDHARWSLPTWVSDDPVEKMKAWEASVREIGHRYGSIIKRWDVVNEVVPDRGMPISRPMPKGYPFTAFEWAERYLPADCQLDINELSDVWDDLMPHYAELIRSLLARGARVGGIGLQCHLSGDGVAEILEGKQYRPQHMLNVLDEAASFGRPVHVSEVTIPPTANNPQGLLDQAYVARQLYRLWFSHQAVTGITWWNLPDGGQADGEPEKQIAGILDRELRPKPAYDALQQLLHREWRTRLSIRSDSDGRCTFRGFYGRYCLSVLAADKTWRMAKTFELSPADRTQIIILCLDD